MAKKITFQPAWETASDEQIRIYGLVGDSIVDGPGLRFSIFVQGCSHHCPGCHNPESQPIESGEVYTLAQIRDEILSNKLIVGVTFSGGEPFEQAWQCAPLAAKLKEDGYNIWAYSGYLAEELFERAKEDPAIATFLENIDVLIDGPFIESLQSYELEWRGSSNQRLIDMPKTLESEHIIEWSPPSFEVSKPPSW